MAKQRKQYEERLNRHKDAILMMYAPNPSGGMMVSGSADEHIRVWDMERRTISGYIPVSRPSDRKLVVR